MEWIALAIVFCFLMWKWPRKTIIGVCGVVSFAAIVGIGCFTKIKIDRLLDGLPTSVIYFICRCHLFSVSLFSCMHRMVIRVILSVGYTI